MATLDELTKAFRDIHKAEMAETDPKRKAQLAEQGNSIMRAIDRAAHGVQPGAFNAVSGTPDATPDLNVPAAAPSANPLGFVEGAPATLGAQPAAPGPSRLAGLDPNDPTLMQKAQLALTPLPASGTTVMPQPVAPAPAVAPTAQPDNADPFPDFQTWVNNSKRGGAGGAGLVTAQRGSAAAGAEASAANAAERAAIKARAAGQGAAGKSQGAAIADYVTNLAIAGQEHADKDALLQRQAQDALAKSQQATDEFKRAASEGTLAQSLGSGGGKFLSAISVALGAVSAGLTKSGVNPGLQVLNARLEADMRDRMERLRGKAEARDQLDGLYKAHLAALGDERAAADRTKADILEQLKLEVSRQAAVSGGEDARRAGDVVVAGMDAELARAKEASANQLLLAKSKASGAGRKSMTELYQEWDKAHKVSLENQKLAGEVDAQRNPSAGGDLGTVEGSRAAARKKAVFEATNDLDAVIEQGTKLLTTIGTPDRATRALSGTPGALLLSDKSQEQLGALALFTQNMTRSMQGARPSDRDAVISKLELLRQGVTTGKAGMDTIIRDILDLAKSSRARAASFDPQAAAAYDRERTANKPGDNAYGYVPPSFTPVN